MPDDGEVPQDGMPLLGQVVDQQPAEEDRKSKAQRHTEALGHNA